MLALKIIDIKSFMNQLLIGETFDHFQMTEASITTYNTFSIDGKIHHDFFDSDTCELLEQNEQLFSFWKDVKPYCFSIIRGKQTPLYFKIVFQFSGQQARKILSGISDKLSPEMVRGLFLNLQFRNNELLCTTGISLNTFFPDKTPEQIWDTAVCNFFRQHEIVFEKL